MLIIDGVLQLKLVFWITVYHTYTFKQEILNMTSGLFVSNGYLEGYL